MGQQDKPNKIFKFIKLKKREGKNVEGGKCITGRHERIGFSQEDQCKIWKEHILRIINEKTAGTTWGTAMVEKPVEKVSPKKVREAIRKMKQGKAERISETTPKMIVAGGKIAEEVMLQLGQRVLDEKGTPNKWKTSVVVPIFKGKGDVMSCGSNRGVCVLFSI